MESVIDLLFLLSVVTSFKVLEYLCTCNIFYLINGPRVTFFMFVTFVRKGYFKLSNKIKINYKLIYILYIPNF